MWSGRVKNFVLNWFIAIIFITLNEVLFGKATFLVSLTVGVLGIFVVRIALHELRWLKYA